MASKAQGKMKSADSMILKIMRRNGRVFSRHERSVERMTETAALARFCQATAGPRKFSRPELMDGAAAKPI